MSKQKESESSLLWDCFINWSLTLEKKTPKEPEDVKKE